METKIFHYKKHFLRNKMLYFLFSSNLWILIFNLASKHFAALKYFLAAFWFIGNAVNLWNLIKTERFRILSEHKALEARIYPLLVDDFPRGWRSTPAPQPSRLQSEKSAPYCEFSTLAADGRATQKMSQMHFSCNFSLYFVNMF